MPQGPGHQTHGHCFTQALDQALSVLANRSSLNICIEGQDEHLILINRAHHGCAHPHTRPARRKGILGRALDPLLIQIPEIRCHECSATDPGRRSEEHTSELQSLMRISYAVFCLTKTNAKY